MKKHIKTISMIILIAGLLLPYQNCAEIFPAKHSEATATSSAATLAFLEAEAMGVLQKNCATCHSPNSGVETPIADITDLEALVANGYYEMGSPETSQIYLDLIDEIMPPSPNELLSALDLERIRVWLLGENASTDDISIIVGGGGGGESTSAATFAEIFDTIIAPRCLNCHGTGSGRSLANYDDVMDYVIPNNFSNSEFYIQVNTGLMPRNAAPLSAYERSRIANWIFNGAQP